MAVTNAQVLAAIETLESKLAELKSVEPTTDFADYFVALNAEMQQLEEKLENKLSRLDTNLHIRDAKFGGDSTETIRLLDSIDYRLSCVEKILSSRPAPVRKTLRQHWDELSAYLMGPNPSKH